MILSFPFYIDPQGINLDQYECRQSHNHSGNGLLVSLSCRLLLQYSVQQQTPSSVKSLCLGKAKVNHRRALAFLNFLHGLE